MTYLEKTLTKEALVQAFSTIERSTAHRTKKLLLVTGDESRRTSVHDTLGGGDLEIVDAKERREMLDALANRDVDGVVIDLRFPGISALELAEEIQDTCHSATPPILLYSKRKPNDDELAQMQQLARRSVVRHAQSVERLLDETVLLLHRAEADLTQRQRDLLAAGRRRDEVLAGRMVLVIDDDVRNIFALTSVLEQHNLKVIHAENGRAGIELLKRNPGVDAVLMDIMMPEMDGYETTRAIRHLPEFETLPIIALT